MRRGNKLTYCMLVLVSAREKRERGTDEDTQRKESQKEREKEREREKKRKEDKKKKGERIKKQNETKQDKTKTMREKTERIARKAMEIIEGKRSKERSEETAVVLTRSSPSKVILVGIMSVLLTLKIVRVF